LRLRTPYPNVHRHEDGAESYWHFHYWRDERQPSGLVKTTREIHRLGPASGAAALTRKKAEAERDRFLEDLAKASERKEPLVLPANSGEILFGILAEIWEWDYVERLVGGKPLIAASTKGKYRNHLHNHVLPRWATTPIGQLRAKTVLDWLQTESGSWFMMVDLRNIMSGIFTKAQEWEILPDTFANPIARVKLPKKWTVYEKRILSEQETVRVLGQMEDPHRLISEICLATGTRISEVTGLQVKHVNLARAFLRIEQRHWRGDIDEPKTERSKRTLTLGSLAGRVKTWIESLDVSSPDAWVFPQPNPSKPMWDSGVRAALQPSKRTATSQDSDFILYGAPTLLGGRKSAVRASRRRRSPVMPRPR